MTFILYLDRIQIKKTLPYLTYLGAVQPLDKVLGGASNGGKTLSIS